MRDISFAVMTSERERGTDHEINKPIDEIITRGSCEKLRPYDVGNVQFNRAIGVDKMSHFVDIDET